MTKRAAKKTTSIEDWEKSFAIKTAKQMYVTTVVNMGWQLAIAILLPVYIGVQLDKHFNSGSSYTLTALFLAVILAGVIVYKTVGQVNKKQNLKGGSK